MKLDSPDKMEFKSHQSHYLLLCDHHIGRDSGNMSGYHTASRPGSQDRGDPDGEH